MRNQTEYGRGKEPAWWQAKAVTEAFDPSERTLRQELTQARDLLRQREREIAEINHRVSNSLQLASSVLSLQRSRLRNDEAKQALDAAISRIGAIGRLHRHFYESRAVGRLDFGKFLKELQPEISTSTGLDCKIDADAVEVSGEKALHLAVALNELVLNARKHAYDGKDGGKISITCRKNGTDRLHLSVADGGKGLPEDFSADGATGLGMTVVTSIVRQLGGELRVGNASGACFILTVPAP